MIGRTNIIFGSGGVTTVDLPTCPSSLTASPGNSKVTLTIAYSDTDFVSGVEVRYKTDSYPTSPTDGDGVAIESATTAVEISGLTNGTTYYFRVFLYRTVGGVKYFQTDITNARISCIPRAVAITGLTPMVEAADHIVITESGTFTLTANAGTKIVLGSAGGGQSGGFVAEHTLAKDVVDAECTLVISATRKASSSKITIGETTYDCGSTEQIVQSKWGPIGGKGGNAGYDGTGAGGGGGGITNGDDGGCYKTGGKGGNFGGYGNLGGNGGFLCSGGDGASGKGGGYAQAWHLGGSGGGGGYASGGGAQGQAYNTNDEQSNLHSGEGGVAGTGIVVIEWD